MPPPDVPEFRSADGRFVVEFWLTEGPRMSHVIVQARLTDTRSGAVLLDLGAAATWDWDCDPNAVRAEGGVVELPLRRYPAGGSTASCTVVVDADRRTYALRDVVRPKRMAPLVERLRLGGLSPA